LSEKQSKVLKPLILDFFYFLYISQSGANVSNWVQYKSCLHFCFPNFW